MRTLIWQLVIVTPIIISMVRSPPDMDDFLELFMRTKQAFSVSDVRENKC